MSIKLKTKVYYVQYMFIPTLIDLASFVSNDKMDVIIVDETAVKEYIEDTKASWSNGNYWLGGQIKIGPNDKITDELMDKVRQKRKETGDYYCNSFEYASMLRSERQFAEIETIVKRYREVMKRCVIEVLNKTGLNADVNGLIISMCG